MSSPQDAGTLASPGAVGADCDVSVILVSYNTASLVVPCLDHLSAARGTMKVQVLVVDNASLDDSVEVLRHERARIDELVENTVNVGFGRANNQVLDRVRGRHVLLLNIDAFIPPESLRLTLDYMDAHPRCGVLGVQLIGRDGTPQPSCRFFPTPWNVFLYRTGLHRFFPGTRLVDDTAWKQDTVRQCDWVPGCYYLIRSEVIATVGLFDPRYFLYCEEVDHCRRVKAAGWDVTYFPHTSVIHIGGESAKSVGPQQTSALQIESDLLYVRKHHGLGGAWLTLGLTALGDFILALKALLKMRPAAAVGQAIAARGSHTARHVVAFWRTGAGGKATR
jgi:GT2 family glycosyltransferase